MPYASVEKRRLKQREQKRRYYQTYKAAGRCPGCKRQVVGRVRCERCYLRDLAYRKPRS